MSAHTTPEELDMLLCAHPEMEFVLLQINYADCNDPAVQAEGCYETARMKDNIATMKDFKLLSKEEEAVEEKAQAAPGSFPYVNILSRQMRSFLNRKG